MDPRVLAHLLGACPSAILSPWSSTTMRSLMPMTTRMFVLDEEDGSGPSSRKPEITPHQLHLLLRG